MKVRPGGTLCPSAPCQPGALLVGVVLSNGKVAFVQERVVINEEFVSVAQEGRPPEKRFRFASTCVERACGQWEEGRCGVMDFVTSRVRPHLADELLARSLPPCSIRAQCRWFLQSGAEACQLCPLIVTDVSAEAP